MIVILRHYVPNETGKIARSISIIQNVFELSSFSLIDELQIIVLLIEELFFHLIESLLLG